MATKRPRSSLKEVKVPTWVLVHPGPSTAIREEWFPVIVQREECKHRDKRTTAHPYYFYEMKVVGFVEISK
jgi:hypothetical protein